MVYWETTAYGWYTYHVLDAWRWSAHPLCDIRTCPCNPVLSCALLASCCAAPEATRNPEMEQPPLPPQNLSLKYKHEIIVLHLDICISLANILLLHSERQSIDRWERIEKSVTHQLLTETKVILAGALSSHFSGQMQTLCLLTQTNEKLLHQL